MPAGPASDVGRGLLPPMRASGKRMPEPRLLKKSAIKIYFHWLLYTMQRLCANQDCV